MLLGPGPSVDLFGVSMSDLVQDDLVLKVLVHELFDAMRIICMWLLDVLVLLSGMVRPVGVQISL